MTLSSYRIVKPSIAHPKTELICIGDSVGAGLLDYRDEKRARLLPSSRLSRWWAKCFFENHHLRLFRR